MGEVNLEKRESLHAQKEQIQQAFNVLEQPMLKLPDAKEVIKLTALTGLFNNQELTTEAFQRFMIFVENTISDYMLVVAILNSTIVVNLFDDPNEFLCTAINKGDDLAKDLEDKLEAMFREQLKEQNSALENVEVRLAEITKQINEEAKKIPRPIDFSEKEFDNN